MSSIFRLTCRVCGKKSEALEVVGGEPTPGDFFTIAAAADAVGWIIVRAYGGGFVVDTPECHQKAFTKSGTLRKRIPVPMTVEG